MREELLTCYQLLYKLRPSCSTLQNSVKHT